MKLILLTILLAIAATSFAQKKVVCYYASWATYRPDNGKFSIQDIKANLCTHVAYSFVGITRSGEIKVLDNEEDLPRFTRHVKKYSGVKALLSIGGASEKSAKFSDVVHDPNLRATFVKNAVKFLKKHNFDGLDVDWEYPARGTGTRNSDKDNYVLLLKELKNAFKDHGFTLSAAVAAEADAVDQSYIVPRIATHLDFINVMTYDFNGDWSDSTGMNSPLYASSKDSSYQKTLNADAAIKHWISRGAPAEKIVMGIPFYGRTFTLKDPNNHKLHAPFSKPGKAGRYTGEPGYIGYNEMCVKVNTGTWKVVFDQEQKVPYAYKNHQWVSYDDVNSIKQKVKYIKQMGLGGAMIWSIDTDDLHGDCGEQYSLLNIINRDLNSCKFII